jgi:hypothetical protein
MSVKTRTSRSTDAELEDFANRLKQNSFEWAQKQYKQILPLARRYGSTNDPKYEKYHKMAQMILKEFNN